MNKPAFDIVTVEEANNEWILRGRSWENIRVNDILVADYIEGDERDRQFTVIVIETYGHLVDELFRMMTGSLVVSGRNGNLLRPGTKLVANVAGS